MHHPAGGPLGRCPVQPSTPLGPDQANVYLFIYLRIFDGPVLDELYCILSVDTQLFRFTSETN
jgi:hypothetical protein